MILPVSHSNCNKREGAKRKLSLGPDESSSDDATTDSESDQTIESESESDLDEEYETSEERLRKTWGSISVPVREEDIKGKWFGVIYSSKRTKHCLLPN